MDWKSVGSWIKDNASTGAQLIGSLITGNVPGAVAAGVSMVSSATGTDNPEEAMVRLQNNSGCLVKLREIAAEKEEDIRRHIETMERMRLEDIQKEHEQTQKTIRQGDQALDEKVRMTRPTMAKQSWIATIAYCLGCFGVLAINGDDMFNGSIAMILSSPAWAYLGLRTTDKISTAWKERANVSRK